MVDSYRKEWSRKVKVGRSRFGKGVFAIKDFSAGQRLASVKGTIVDIPNSKKEEYYVEFHDDLILEPYPPFRYLNHSCEPNCEFDYESGSRGRKTMYVRALRDICKGEELRNDYAWPADDPIPCLCGAGSCRKWMVAASQVRKVTRKPLSITKFPDEFVDLLNPSGKRILQGGRYGERRVAKPGNLSAVKGVLKRNVVSDCSLLLATCFDNMLRRMRARITDASLVDMKSSYAEKLEKTLDFYTVDLNSSQSRAGIVAESIGLTKMINSDSFRKFAEIISEVKLEPGPDLQIQCYEEGQYVGPHNDHFPEFVDAGRGYIDVQLTFCDVGVKEQKLVYAKNGFFSESVDIAESGLINVSHLPFWHYTTPMEIMQKYENPRRWLIVASFDIVKH